MCKHLNTAYLPQLENLLLQGSFLFYGKYYRIEFFYLNSFRMSSKAKENLEESPDTEAKNETEVVKTAVFYPKSGVTVME